MHAISALISQFQLIAHPEGGYYRETYRSQGTIAATCLDAAYSGERNFSTGIYFLLTSDTFSAFHRILQDEAWHFYAGSAILLHMIDPSGHYSAVTIGNRFDQGEVPQFVVPGGTWFASHVIQPDAYALLGCTVSPGFDFRDFDLTPRHELLQRFPQHAEIITQLTRV